MKNVYYKELADVLEECLQYAKNLKIKVENPEGKKETFRISDISITLLNYQKRSLLIKNGISGDIQSSNRNSELDVRIWIANDVKKIKTNICYSGILPDPISLKIFFRSSIYSYIITSINEFFSSKTKDNKYSSFSEEISVIDDKEPCPMEEFTDDSLKKIENILRWLYSQKNVCSVRTNLTINRKVWIVCNSHGTKIIQNQDSCSMNTFFEYLSKKRLLLEDCFIEHFKKFQDLVSSLDNAKIEFLKKLSQMEMKRIESGIYPILLRPNAVATLFHEAIAGHMLSARIILDGGSTIFEQKLGRRFVRRGIIPVLDHISIYDKPLEESMNASYKYDMEGTPAQNICLLRRGVVENYLTDKNTAARLKQKSNGHHLGQSFIALSEGTIVAVMPEPRVSNLIIESHTNVSLEETKQVLFENFDWYLEIDSGNGQVFVNTGTFDLFANNVTKVHKDGRREAICPGKLSSNMTDFLAAILIVSNHYGESKGFCGSNSGYVPTHNVAPAMVLHGINFVPDPKPEKITEINLSRDKYIPDFFLEV
jgi:predicted Zn-dependent protease